MSSLPLVLSALPGWACAVLAVAPAGVTLSLGGKLARAVDDPTLPERWWAFQRRHTQTTVASLTALLLLAGPHRWWAVPLWWIAGTAAMHRVRRPLYGETWTLAGMAAWNLRFIVAVLGFWLLLASTPLIVMLSPRETATALSLGALLVAWNHFYADLLARVLGARPLARAELQSAFDAVLERADADRPRLLHAGPKGGLVPNAFALPSLRGSSVLFLDSLLERFTPEESAAILGHELAHVEYYDRRRLRRLYACTLLGIASAVGIVP